VALSSDSDTAPGGVDELEAAVADLTDVLRAVASGDFSRRARRSMRGNPVDVLAFLVNATAEEVSHLVEELERTRQQLAVTEKLAALGELSGGIAHELNQPLTAIRICADMLRECSDEPVSAHLRHVELIAEASTRMAKIVDAIRTFARNTPMQRRPVPALAPLEDALRLFEDIFRTEGIVLERELEARMLYMSADHDRLQQVFVNLLANARDAIRANAPGSRRIVVSARAQRQMLRFTIEDSGPGVAARDVPRLFDPFFTTKPVGEGTGLGLSVSHGIVLEHDGSIEYEPAAGGGACFSIWLPCLNPPASE
jgi:C4-dicarboxylate-specific signal transduction histidine kinase